MDLNDIGFSNIRLPDDKNSYIYTYDPRIETFPEEVFLHEFLHSLERDMKEHGYDIPALHSNEQHGYVDQPKIGLKDWYHAYMTKTILDKTTNTYIGLYPEVYTMKPPHKSEFDYPINVSFNQEPKNVFDDIKDMIGVLIGVFKGQTV